MSVMEALTIWISRIAMNIPTTIAMNPAHWRQVSAGASGASDIIA